MMDPNANLAEQRTLARSIQTQFENAEDTRAFSDLAHDANRLADLVIALDEWMVRGGSRPAAWG